MLGRLTVILCTLAWTAAAAAPPINARETAAFAAAHKALVRGSLKDPSSAQFQSVFVSRGTSGARILCGEVNAKNSFGGYVGFKRFYAVEAGWATIDNEDEADVFRAMWPQVCGDKIADVK